MSVRKIRNSWWVDFRVSFTRYRKRSPENSRQGAQAYEALLRSQILSGRYGDRHEKGRAFGAFAIEWLATYVASNNKPSEQMAKRRTFHRHLLPSFGHRPLRDLSVRDIERYKSEKTAAGLSAKTVNNHLTMLRRCLQCAVEWGELTAVPKVQWLKAMRPVVHYLRDDECPRLLDAAYTACLRCMILVALRTGLRVGELLGLRWPDVNLTLGTLTVHRAVAEGVIGTPKGHRARAVPLPPDAMAELILLRRDAPDMRGEVFRDPAGKPLTRQQAAHGLYRSCRLAGIREVGWHTLRHAYATQLVARGAPLRAVQELLGHSTILMTERYAHVAPDTLRAAVALLSRGQQVGNTTGSAAHGEVAPTAGNSRFSALQSEKDTASAVPHSW